MGLLRFSGVSFCLIVVLLFPTGVYVHVPDPHAGGLGRRDGPNSGGGGTHVGSVGCHILYSLPSLCHIGKYNLFLIMFLDRWPMAYVMAYIKH